MLWHCPICSKPTDSDAMPEFPFCGERCRLLDLGNWASERYVISEPAADETSLPPSQDSSDGINEK
jgi:uncharacterized protein